LTAVTLLLASATGPAIAQSVRRPEPPSATTSSGEGRRALARPELKLGVCAFRTQEYATAQRHFERALEIDPTDDRLPLYIARAMKEQCPIGEPETAEQVRRIRAAYEQALARCPNDEEVIFEVGRFLAFSYELEPATDPIPALEEASDWIAARAHSPLLSAGTRAALWHEIAAARCLAVMGALPSTFPPGPIRVAANDRAGLVRLRANALAALAAVERSLSLSPTRDARGYKMSILFSLAKIAELERKGAEAARYDRKANEARQRWKASEWTSEPAPVVVFERQTETFLATGTFRQAVDLRALMRTEIVGTPLQRPTRPIPAKVRAELERLKAPPKDESVETEHWKPFEPADGSFRVSMPASANERVGEGEISMCGAESAGVYYFVVWYGNEIAAPELRKPASPNAPHGASPAFMILASSAAEVLWKLFNAEDADMEIGFSWRQEKAGVEFGQFHATTTDLCGETKHALLRCVATGDRFYALYVIGADENDPRVSAFFDSLAVPPASETTSTPTERSR
jgi:tetratricopeptide (TPR) repeat protein